MSWIIRGEVFVSLEDISEACHVEITWVEEVFQMGLIGEGETRENRTLVPAHALDRVIRIRRITLQTGLELDVVAAFFNA